jgi:drug/metabolite transporter (DMT)-like permease
MSGIVIGILAACGASACYAVGDAMQALEARAAPGHQALRLALFRRLVRRPRWVVGTAFGLTGWALQTLALVHAPLTLVQPLLGISLVVLLGIANVWLGERPRRGDIFWVLVIAAGVPLLAITTPHHTTAEASNGPLAISLTVLGLLALTPLALRGGARSASILVPIGAGLAFSWDGLATKFASDAYVHEAWIGAAAWFIGMNVAAGLGTLGQMSSLQRRPVTQVAPIVYALTTFVPVGLAPVLAREWWSGDPLRDIGLVVSLLMVGVGAIGLARSGSVGRVLLVEASSASSETPRRRRDDSSALSAAREWRARV